MIKRLLLFIFLSVPVLHSSAFVIDNFRSELNVQQNGDILVTETIKVNFENDRKKHGIFRNIPYQSKTPKGTHYTPISNFDVRDENNQPRKFSRSKANQNYVLKIGDANKFVQDFETYKISYKIQGVVKKFPDEDFNQIYWNVTGNQWDTRIKKSSAKIILPTASNINKTTCFAGRYGSTEQHCKSQINKNFAVFTSQKGLAPNQGLTIVYGFDTNISTANKNFSEQGKLSTINLVKNLIFKYSLSAGIFFPLLTVLFSIKQAWIDRKKLSINKQIIPKYFVPENITPAVVGHVVDGYFDKQDFTAGILYLATIGAIKIEYEKSSGFLFKRKTLVLLQQSSHEAITQLDEVHKKILNDLFSTGTKFIPSRNKQKLYKIFQNISCLIKDNTPYFLNQDNIKNYNSLSQTKTSINQNSINIQKNLENIPTNEAEAYLSTTPTIKLIKTKGSILKYIHYWMLIPFIIGLLINKVLTILILLLGLVFLSLIAPKRNKKGFEMAYELKCYKKFLKTAEISQLNWASKQDIFEQNLPYAVAFGLEKKWTKKFGDLINVPLWAPKTKDKNISLAKEIKSLTNSFKSNINLPNSSGRSGFGGGGFSGGGSGGGGGSSW